MRTSRIVQAAVVALVLPFVVAAGPKEKVEICHHDADAGSWKLLRVSANAAAKGHARHEYDGVPGGPVEGMDGHVHGDDCTPEAPVEQLWAVAYTDLDGIDGYSAAGDQLIVKVVDDGDGEPGAGDTISWGLVPTRPVPPYDFTDCGLADLTVRSFRSFHPAVAYWAEDPGLLIIRNAHWEGVSLSEQMHLEDMLNASDDEFIWACGEYGWSGPGDQVDEAFVDVRVFSPAD